MSLFRKPKKPIQRRVFSGYDDEDEENHGSSAKDSGHPNGAGNGTQNGTSVDRSTPMDVDPVPEGPAVATASVAPSSSSSKRKEHRAAADSGSKGSSLKANPSTKPSLLSFDDEGNKKPLI